MKTDDRLKQAAELIAHLVEENSLTPAEFCRRIRNREKGLGVTESRYKEWISVDQSWKSPNPIVSGVHFSKLSGSSLPVQWAASRFGARFVPGAEYFTGHQRFSDLYIEARREVSRLRNQIESAIFNDSLIDTNEAGEISVSWMKFCLWADGVVTLLNKEALVELSDPVSRLHEAPGKTASHVCVRDALDSSSRSAQQIAEACGFKQAASVNKWGEESGRVIKEFRGKVIDDTEKKSGSPNPFDYTVRIAEVTKDFRPVKLMCELLGGRLVEAPPRQDAEMTDLHRTWVRVDTEIAEFMGAIGRAVEDEKLDADEIDQIATEWLDVRSWMETFVGAMGEGRFGGSGLKAA